MSRQGKKGNARQRKVASSRSRKGERYSSRKAWNKIFALDFEKCHSYLVIKDNPEEWCFGKIRMNMRFKGDKEHRFRMCDNCPKRLRLYG